MNEPNWIPWQDTFSMTITHEPVHVRVSVTGATLDEAARYRDYLDTCVNALRGMDPGKLGDVLKAAKNLDSAIAAWHRAEPVPASVGARWRGLQLALAPLETPVNDDPTLEGVEYDLKACELERKAATEPEATPVGIVCQCCWTVFGSEADVIDHMNRRRRQSNYRIEQLEAQLAEATAEHKAVRSGNDDLRSRIDTCHNTICRLRGERNRAQVRLEEARTQRDGACRRRLQARVAVRDLLNKLEGDATDGES